MTYHYRVQDAGSVGASGRHSNTVTASTGAFASDDEFLDFLQYAAFQYFWREANPANGLVRDRSRPDSVSSIAATGFGLTALGIGIDRGWITRAEGRERALTTLRTFWERPQGAGPEGCIGYRGWFYHFLDMNTALRVWRCELSSIDTALFLAGMLDAGIYFDQPEAEEPAIRALAGRIFDRIDWQYLATGTNSLSMGWRPETGFIEARWIGYNEAMILYILGLGATVRPLASDHWTAWTSGYSWTTHFGQDYVAFAPLFGHQYSHCWIDFRQIADGYLQRKGIDYFENSRRATLAQRAYCIANPGGFPGYGAEVWGLTACDGPGSTGFFAYIARGAPPAENDDGTIAPTAVGGSLPFAPEYCLPTLRHFYDRYRTRLWTGYGFRDAFNLTADWWGPDVLGIDQGPILIMAENHRTGSVWRRFMREPIVHRGLAAAGFAPVTAADKARR
ncbi:MAG: Tat pathway signal protein [Verrucomicrobia bacterium]|nr:Tat pathway signal protein [Verrucomicrobiota bacterium]